MKFQSLLSFHFFLLGNNTTLLGLDQGYGWIKYELHSAKCLLTRSRLYLVSTLQYTHYGYTLIMF